MSKKKSVIKRGNIFHSIYYRTFEVKKSLRYCLSLFISGLLFFIVSLKVDSIALTNTLQVFASILLIFSGYIFPFWDFEKVDNFFRAFAKYLGFLYFFIIITVIWITLCFNENNSKILIIIIPISLVEALVMISFFNFTLKPIIEIIGKISEEIKRKSEETNNDNNENKTFTYIKTICANVSFVISFILSILTLFTTVNNFVSLFHN